MHNPAMPELEISFPLHIPSPNMLKESSKKALSGSDNRLTLGLIKLEFWYWLNYQIIVREMILFVLNNRLVFAKQEKGSLEFAQSAKSRQLHAGLNGSCMLKLALKGEIHET